MEGGAKEMAVVRCEAILQETRWAHWVGAATFTQSTFRVGGPWTECVLYGVETGQEGTLTRSIRKENETRGRR